jgi:hypothetical protein
LELATLLEKENMASNRPNPKTDEMCERSVARAFRLCDELKDVYGIHCEPVVVSDEELLGTSIIHLSKIEGAGIEVRWGMASEQKLSAFLSIEWTHDEDSNEEVNDTIKQALEVDLMDLTEAFGIELGPAEDR